MTHGKNVFRVSGARLFALAALALGLSEAGGEVFGGEEVARVEILGVEGLRFSPARFVVRPGQAVELTLRNEDEMQHNLLITRPGKREEVAELAMRMGGDGFAKEFIPESEVVLFHTGLLRPEESQTIRFTAPETEGVYPYVCTFPGHASIMFGAMYVTEDEAEVPALRDDPHVPAHAREEEVQERRVRAHHGHDPSGAPRRQIRRTFVPEAGPAAIAVHAGRNLSYVWDAGTCHLRYAWWGGFVDSARHWSGNQSDLSEIDGHIYHRAGPGFPLRLGDPEATPERKFLGYRIVDELPVFEYTVDGRKVTQQITALEEGTGLRMAFKIPDAAEPVFYRVDPAAGAAFVSSAGEWEKGVLTLSPEEARSFTLTLTERPRHEPFGYWPMDDDVWTNKNERMFDDAKVGGSLAFTKHEINTGITGADVGDSATFAGWVKLREPDRENQFLFGQREPESEREFSLRYRKDDGFVVTYPQGNGGLSRSRLAGPLSPANWNHFAMTVSGGTIEVHVNGEYNASLEGRLLGDVPFTLGASEGEFYADALFDEFRVWNRAVEAEELRGLYEIQAQK